jgi:hypothetical protein
MYPEDILDAAHKHSSRHRDEVERSEVCGCFYCCKTCAPTEIEDWLVEEPGGTALCPNCGIDSLIGSASGYAVGEPAFLNAMHQRWFT